MSLQDLERLLIERGRRISVSGLSKIENGDRRVDVDDLVALAVAMDVSPLALLLPETAPSETVEISGGRASAGLVWLWSYGQHPLADPDARRFKARSMPGWFDPNASIEWSEDMTLASGLPKGELVGRIRIMYGIDGPEDDAVDYLDRSRPRQAVPVKPSTAESTNDPKG